MHFWSKKQAKSALSPDEIFLDAANIPGFVQERFEGVIEQPLGKAIFYAFGALLFLLGAVLFGRVAWLEIARGKELQARATSNYIRKTYTEPPRGLFLDRNGIPLVSNEIYTDETGVVHYRRVAAHPYAFSHILGFVGTAGKDDAVASGLEVVGKAGLERYYNDKLEGSPGERDEELDAHGTVVAEGPLEEPKKGNDVELTIDASLQEKLWELLNQTMEDRGFRGGAGVVFSVKDGSILALTSVPSFDINAFSQGLTPTESKALFSDPRSPLFNRAVAGAFAPGSVIKPFYAVAALEEGIIDPARQLFSAGFISIPDPYHPGQSSKFLDWKAHGYIDMRHAIAVSSDVYFYTIGGGYGDVAGLGIRRLKGWLGRFGFDALTHIDLGGEERGFLPDPDWKAWVRKDDPTWRIGDTYHVSIGQGDLLVTPVAVAHALGALATHGLDLPLHFLKQEEGTPPNLLSVKNENYQVVLEGMHLATQAGGTAGALSWVPFPVAGKTGTAEVGNKERVNSWFMGFAPYDNPQIGMVVFLESGPRSNLVGASFVTSELFRWILDQGGIDKLVR